MLCTSSAYISIHLNKLPIVPQFKSLFHQAARWSWKAPFWFQIPVGAFWLASLSQDPLLDQWTLATELGHSALHGCSYGSHLNGGEGSGMWEVGRPHWRGRRSQKRRGFWDKTIRVYCTLSLLSRQIAFHLFAAPSGSGLINHLFLFSFTFSICFSTWALKFAQGPPVLEDHPITLLQAPAQLGTISLYQVNFIHPLLTFYPNLASSPLTPAACISPRCFLVLEGLKTRQREGSMKCIGHCE